MGLQSPVRAPDRGPAGEPGRTGRSTARRPDGAAPFRTDIQALRAVAVALVVVYHLWPGGVPGGFIGVDVFFVISGFLITAHLLAHPPRGRGPTCARSGPGGPAACCPPRCSSSS